MARLEVMLARAALAPRRAPVTELPFRFLDLPTELRIEVLSLVAREQGRALLGRSSNGVISSTDNISMVNKEIRTEYLGTLYGHAQLTLVLAVDFDFGHVISYLKKLQAAEARALPKKAASKDLPSDHYEKRVFTPDKFYTRSDRDQWFLMTMWDDLSDTSDEGAPDSATSSAPLKSRQLKVLLDFSRNPCWRSVQLRLWLDFFGSDDNKGVRDVKVEFETAFRGGFLTELAPELWAEEMLDAPMTQASFDVLAAMDVVLRDGKIKGKGQALESYDWFHQFMRE